MNTRMIQVAAQVPASVERVYLAWTNPELAMKWFCGEGIRPADLEIDFRVGGRYRATQIILDEEFTVSGVYIEIEEHKKIVFTHEWHDPLQFETTVTVEFNPDGHETEVVVTQNEFVSDGQADGQKNGWQNALDSLVQKFTEGVL